MEMNSNIEMYKGCIYIYVNACRGTGLREKRSLVVHEETHSHCLKKN